jgi:hypothetical protein
MVFARPVTEWTFDDIQALVDNEEPESVTLEYKREIDTSPGGKKELAKDVSAMANSQGGHLIIGLAEEDHRPQMPDHFVGRMLGQQKVEEWLEQVLNSNVQPRVGLRIRPISVPDTAAECVVVIEIPQSPRVPHMVTTEGEKRYYVRHNFQTLPAEEYEVRDMFERGGKTRKEVEGYLRKRGYFEPDDDPQFAMNKLTTQLSISYWDDTRTPVIEPAHTVVSLVACPTMLGQWVDTSSQEFRDWFQSTKRLYYPGGLFIPSESSQTTLEGVICKNYSLRDEQSRLCPIRDYLLVHQNGYAEYGYGDGITWEGRRLVNFVKMTGRFWQFLGFVRDLYRYAKLSISAIVLLNLSNLEATRLGMLGDGWRAEIDPFARTVSGDESLERHIQIVTELDIQRFEPDQIEAIVRGVAAKVGNAFGQDEPRCFNCKDGSFPDDRFMAYTG